MLSRQTLLLISFLILSLCLGDMYQPPILAGQFIWDFRVTGPDNFYALAGSWNIPGLTTSKSKVSWCGGWPYLGGLGIPSQNTYFERTYTGLPTHDIIYFSMSIQMINNWQSTDSFTLTFDGGNPSTWTSTSSGLYTSSVPACTFSDSTPHTDKNLDFTFAHSASSITLRVTLSLSGSAALGLRNVQFLLHKQGKNTLSPHYKCPDYYSYDGEQCVACPTSCALCIPSSSICISCDYKTILATDGTCQSSCQANQMIKGSGDLQSCIAVCPSGQSMNWEYNCVSSCDPPLEIVSTNGVYTCNYKCNQAAGEYLDWNGNCLNTCSYSARNQDGYLFCDACSPSSSFLYQNGTCLSICQQQFLPETRGGSQFCNFPCSDNSQFLYLNGSCLPSCQDQFNKRVEGGTYKFCDFPCQLDKYLYANGSCLATCQDQLHKRVEGGFQFCDFPCPINQYLYPNGSCMGSCQTQFNERIEGPFKFCDYPCQLSQFLYANKSCLSICQTQLSPRREGSFQFCDFPCQLNQFLYYNDTCHSNCQYHFNQRVEGSFQFCDFPCQLDQYLYANGTCKPTCQVLFNQRYEGVLQFCDFPCQLSQYLYANRTCPSTCQPFFNHRQEGDFLFCDNPCQPHEYLYGNGSCLSTCGPLFNVRIEGSNQFCDYPCQPDQYLYQNKTCIPSCKVPFNRRQESTFQFCDFSCGSLSNFYYPEDQSCDSSCEYPYAPQANVICSLDLSPSQLDQAKTLGDVSDLANQFLFGGGAAGSLADSGSSGAFGSVALAKMLYYIRYLKIKYPPFLQVILNSQNTKTGTFPFFKGTFKKITDESVKFQLPENFEKYDFHSSFLINFWDQLMLIAFLLGLILLIYILNKLAQSCNILKAPLQSAQKAFQWNLFFTFFLTYYDFVVVYTCFDIGTAHPETLLSILSLVVCAMINFIAIAIPLVAFIIVLKYQSLHNNLRKIRHFDERWINYEVTYKTFKGRSFSSKSFFYFFILRLYLFYLIIAYSFDYPLLQASLITILSVLMLAYLSLKRPWKEFVKQVQFLVQEILIFMVNICVLILAILDNLGHLAVNVRIFRGYFILGCNIAFFIVGNVAIRILVFSKIKAFYQQRKMDNHKSISLAKQTPARERVKQLNTLVKNDVQSSSFKAGEDSALALDPLSSSFTGDTTTFIMMKQSNLLQRMDRDSGSNKLSLHENSNYSDQQFKPTSSGLNHSQITMNEVPSHHVFPKTKGVRISRVRSQISKIDHDIAAASGGDPREQRFAMIDSTKTKKLDLKASPHGQSTSNNTFTVDIDGLIGLNGFSGVFSNKTKEARLRRIKRKTKNTSHHQREW